MAWDYWIKILEKVRLMRIIDIFEQWSKTHYILRGKEIDPQTRPGSYIA